MSTLNQCQRAYDNMAPPEDDNDFLDDWKQAVANDDTVLGYEEWLEHQKEEAAMDAAEARYEAMKEGRGGYDL